MATMHNSQINGSERYEFDITNEERDAIFRFAEKEIVAFGYVSIVDFPLNDIIERNYELSLTAIHNCVYRVCLAHDYDKHGKIVTHKGVGLNALSIIEDHCRSLDRCTLDDLLDLEREITGECHRWIPMQSGYSVMVRTEMNTFIAERLICFDTKAVDGAIEQFLVEVDYLPLKAITTFVMFPYCGYAWNLFLLESYVFRHSGLFRYKVGALNNQNVGVIVRKSSPLIKPSHTKYNKDYDKILVDAIVKSGIPLEKSSALHFLFDEGYIAKKFKTNIEELLFLAKSLRDRGCG